MAGFIFFCALLVLFIEQVGDPRTFNWLNDLPGLDNIRRAAYFAAPVAGLAMAGLSAPPGKGRGFAAIAYALAIALIFWSGARGAVAAIGAAWLISILIFPSLRTPKHIVSIAAATAAGVLLGWLYAKDRLFRAVADVARSRWWFAHRPRLTVSRPVEGKCG